MASSQLFLILVLAMVAGIILFRLYSVLGRRTGNERQPGEKWRFGRLPEAPAVPPPKPATDNVVALPSRTAPPADGVPQGLVDIKLADRSFETDHFLTGAQKAYEMIVEAYAAADRATLKPLLSDEVYAAFDSVMSGREGRNEKVTFAFGGFKSAKILHAEMKGRMAEITVEFSAQYTTSTANAAGTVVDGDSGAMRDVLDRWTFARDVKSGDPNWILVATSGGA
ncbi:MAG TPA: Tim44/TimA family putative adaptor protein [Rhizomicrobium sp.]